MNRQLSRRAACCRGWAGRSLASSDFIAAVNSRLRYPHPAELDPAGGGVPHDSLGALVRESLRSQLLDLVADQPRLDDDHQEHDDHHEVQDERKVLRGL